MQITYILFFLGILGSGGFTLPLPQVLEGLFAGFGFAAKNAPDAKSWASTIFSVGTIVFVGSSTSQLCSYVILLGMVRVPFCVVPFPCGHNKKNLSYDDPRLSMQVLLWIVTIMGTTIDCSKDVPEDLKPQQHSRKSLWLRLTEQLAPQGKWQNNLVVMLFFMFCLPQFALCDGGGSKWGTRVYSLDQIMWILLVVYRSALVACTSLYAISTQVQILAHVFGLVVFYLAVYIRGLVEEGGKTEHKCDVQAVQMEENLKEMKDKLCRSTNTTTFTFTTGAWRNLQYWMFFKKIVLLGLVVVPAMMVLDWTKVVMELFVRL